MMPQVSDAQRCAQALRQGVIDTKFGIAVSPRLSHVMERFVLTFTHEDHVPNGALLLQESVQQSILKGIRLQLPAYEGDIEAACQQLNERLKSVAVTMHCTWSEDQLTRRIEECGGFFPEPFVDDLEYIVRLETPEGTTFEEQISCELDYLLPKDTYKNIIALQ